MIVKFPYSASRRMFARRPRRSKSGTPEDERRRRPPQQKRQMRIVCARVRASWGLTGEPGHDAGIQPAVAKPS
jgi:hypothetical protein